MTSEWPPGWRKHIASVALSRDELDQLDQLARAENVTRSTLIRQLLLEHLNPTPPTPYTW